MKKLFAILMSMLLLCTMIPFAAVSAAGEYSIELVADAEEVNAGDEVAVEVSMYGHEDLGLIGAQIELGFDPDVFELVTYYDEDEEMWMPPIEVGAKFSASYNKYIRFSPIDEETGYMERCLVQFLRETASATAAVKTNLFYTVTFKVKDTAPSGTYEINVINHNDKNIVFYGLGNNPWSWEPISITVNGSEPEVPECEHEYTYPCDKVCSKCYELTNPDAEHKILHVAAKDATCEAEGNIEYWYCEYCGVAWADEALTMQTNLMSVVLPKAKHEYFYECDQYCMNCGEQTNPRAKHSKIHVEAKDPVSCIEYGNVEYWYCEYCGVAWLDSTGRIQTNMMSVRIAGDCVSDAEYPCQDGNCVNCGLPCAAEASHEYFYPCDPVCMVCYELTNPNAAHSLTHVDAVEATCSENGNIEYWTCEHCGVCWDNENATGMPLNRMMVIVPATGEHTYDDDMDVDCNVCGDIRVVEYEVKTYGGASMQESNDGLSGLAFKFCLTDKITGMAVVEGTQYRADYSNAYVTPDSTGTYKLVKMGAKVSNGHETLDIPVEKIVLEGEDAPYYAIRIVNIPATQYGTTISCTPYFVYEDAEGEQVTVDGDVVSSCVNDNIG